MRSIFLFKVTRRQGFNKRSQKVVLAAILRLVSKTEGKKSVRVKLFEPPWRA